MHSFGALTETSVRSHECLEHVWDQRRSVDRVAVGLRVERRITVKVDFQMGWT
ncbi:hypothetical protein AWB64_00163 [Caballeronia sordidicola]|uniref:Uncharacterized protein n=1 Tax=Caballeronia sordidicola TaxID=196367 RepID=A0A158EPY2_CABSO|nr:hypothetical protein AWB64_00163 [Caballeronia sordidicola]